MELILNHIVPKGDTIIKYGQLDDKLLLELRMTTSLYENIEVITNYYDDETYPYFNNWTDVEGMGYGWAWLRHEEKDWHKMMSNLVDREADSLTKDMNNTLYFVYESDNTKTYHFVSIGTVSRTDTLITFSNEEMFY